MYALLKHLSGSLYQFHLGMSLDEKNCRYTCIASCQTGAFLWINGQYISLEKVQKFALKVCTGKWNEDYNSLLNSCKLPTLVSRRHYLKLSLLYQVINGSFTFPNAPLERHSISSNLRSTASSLLLQRPRTPTNAYQYSFGTIYLPPYTAETLCSLLNITIIWCIRSLSLTYGLLL